MQTRELKTKIKAIFFALLFVFSSCEAARSMSEYLLIPHSGARFYIYNYDNSVAIHDLGEPALFCSENSGFQCVVSDFFEFAIPRLEVIPDAWEYDGQKYKVIQKIKRPDEERRLIIENSRFWYMWSEKSGLLMFSFKESIYQGNMYISKDPCGFLAIEQCFTDNEQYFALKY